MRLHSALALLPILAAISFAQETSFSSGPQYLITYGSPLTLRPIATPSLSLGEAQPFGITASASEAVTEQVSTTVASPSDTFLGGVYWGERKNSDIVARRLETPSMTVSDTALYMNAVASQLSGAPAAPATETSEATPGTPVIEIAGSQLPPNLPASIFDIGVTGTTDPYALSPRGYGVSLGDVAAYWKSHKRTAPRVFTNADVGPRR